MVKKAVISILGLAGGKYDNEKGAINFKSKHYYYQNGREEEKKLYSNTLPFLIDTYGEAYEIVPIFTKEAEKVQRKILTENEDKSSWLNIFENGYSIKNENDFNHILKIINEAISSYDRVIFDVTHGFRHLPILAIVNLIIQNIKESEKIEGILFGKEIIKADKDTTGMYDIINLDDYLGLAKLSFVLVNFNTNYTVGNKLSFVNPRYQEIVDSLRIISGHILANSIKTLIDGENNLITAIIEKLESLKKEDSKIKTFSNFINEISEHLKSIHKLKDEKDYKKLFELSQMMREREYLLNSITLLNESIGMFCTEKIRLLSPKINHHIQNYLGVENGNLYELAHHSKNIIKRKESFVGSYLYEPSKIKLTAGQKTSLQKKKRNLKDKIAKNILAEIEQNGFKIELSAIDLKQENSIKTLIVDALKKEDNEDLIILIEKVEQLRNNLAHGNTSDKIKNVKGEISRLSKEYAKVISAFSNREKEVSDKVELQEHVMPNGEVRVVKSLKKRKRQINQTDDDKKVLQEGASVLSDRFNNR